MCGYFCIGSINFVLKGNCLLSVNSPDEYEKNDKIIIKHFR